MNFKAFLVLTQRGNFSVLKLLYAKEVLNHISKLLHKLGRDFLDILCGAEQLPLDYFFSDIEIWILLLPIQ